jgi:pSer/pThr/pTyr-binding forkhead associated (FHA) protein
MKVVLELQDQSANVRKITVRHDIVIGRGSDCNLRLSSPQVSRRHCFLRVSRDGVTVTDLDSSNGTWVQGRRIPSGVRQDVGDGQQLSLGPIRFVVYLRQEAVAASVLTSGTLHEVVQSGALQIDAGPGVTTDDDETSDGTAPGSGPIADSRAEIIDLGNVSDPAQTTVQSASKKKISTPSGPDSVDVLHADVLIQGLQGTHSLSSQKTAADFQLPRINEGDSTFLLPGNSPLRNASAAPAPVASAASNEDLIDEVEILDEDDNALRNFLRGQ